MSIMIKEVERVAINIFDLIELNPKECKKDYVRILFFDTTNSFFWKCL